MRSGLLLGALLFLLPSVALAQTPRFNVEGVVQDSTGSGLPSATIVALTRADSTLSKFSTSGRDGSFIVRRLDPGEYILQITYVGYQTYYHDFDVVDADVRVDTLTLDVLTVALDEFVVNADRIPMSVGRDTIVYNAKAFGARPNEVAEDLLRRLPGIEVARDGSIRAHGEDVENVLVDGKEFFGSDPTIATKNLPAESVDKVEVYDKQSDKAELTGVPDGNEEKTINLELTEDAKSGYFGNITGGLGGENTQQGRYDVRGNLFRFSPKTQLSLLSSANNVSRTGFGVQQIFSMIGSAAAMAGLGSGGLGGFDFGGGGLSEAMNIGLNGSRDLGPKSSLTASYFLSGLDEVRDRTAQRQQVLGSDLAALTDITSNQNSENLGHTATLYAKINLGEGHDMRIRGNLSVGTASSHRIGTQNTSNVRSGGGHRLNSTFREDTDNLAGGMSLVWRKRVAESGRSLVAEGRLNASDASALGYLDSRTTLQGFGDAVPDEVLTQRQEDANVSLSHSQRIGITQPLVEGLTLEAFARHRASAQREDRFYYDLVENRELLNQDLSKEFDQSFRYWSSGVELNYNPKSDAWISGGLTAQRSSLVGTILGDPESITRQYTHLIPWANYRQSFGRGRRANLSYKSSARSPSVNQLQPFTINTNPLNIRVGNPALRPEYSHDLSGAFNFYDQFSFLGYSAGFSVSLTEHEIITSRTVDEQLKQVRTYINADRGSWQYTGRVGFQTPIRPLGIAIDLNNRLSYWSTSEFLNGVDNRNRRLTNSSTFRVRNRSVEVIEVEASLDVSFNRNRYSLNTEANEAYVNYTLHGDLSWYANDKLSFETDLMYRIFDQDVFGRDASRDFPSRYGPQDNILRWDFTASYLVLNKRGEISFEVIDILDQNTGISYSNAPTYVQQEQVLSLGRYVMLKFSYRPKGKAGGFFGF